MKLTIKNTYCPFGEIVIDDKITCEACPLITLVGDRQ